MDDPIKGQIPFGAIVAKDSSNNKKLVQEVIERVSVTHVCTKILAQVREHLGPVYSFKQCISVKRLPKTRSGKILRGTLTKIANKEPYKTPATIDDPAALTELTEAIDKHIAEESVRKESKHHH